MAYFVVAFLLIVCVALLVGWIGNRRHPEVIGSEFISGNGNRRDTER